MVNFFEKIPNPEKKSETNFFGSILSEMESSLEAYDKYKKRGIEFSSDREVVSIAKEKLSLNQIPENVLKKGDGLYEYDPVSSGRGGYLVFVRKENPKIN